MDIEIAVPDRMSQSGKSLLSLIQNNSMETLDLLVRESIQNSLDAKDESKDNVKIDFFYNNFESKGLNDELEGISDALNIKYNNESTEYIAIRDTNTVGLTGVLHADEVQNNEYGNLLKLVYEISKAQDSEGAGGSWGLGKTVYFRVGIGLVLYYSRIKLETGKYESRLVACFVEDETSKDSMIPKYLNRNKRGIAWWGKKTEENKTIPITDESEIKKIIENFTGLPIFEEQETGTMIIIPYIDKERLLPIINSENEMSLRLPWDNKIDEYLKLAIQKWYIPRLNNEDYKYGKWLEAKINGVKLSHKNIYPYFSILQSLYNRASLGEEYKTKNKYKDFIEYYNDNISEEDKVITYTQKITKNKILDERLVGNVSFLKANKKLLHMLSPNNSHSPYEYLNMQESESDKAIVTFTRQPGMLVSYETEGLWTKTILNSNKDEYLIGIFVLNSKNKFKESEKTLEEYIRKSEKADHTSWEDYNVNNKDLKIISKIKDDTAKKIAQAFTEEEDISDRKLNTNIGNEFAKILLPPQGFGRKSGGNKAKGGVTKNNKKVSSNILLDTIKYYSNGMVLPFELSLKEPVLECTIKMQIDTGSSKKSAEKWETEMGVGLPAMIEALSIRLGENQKYDFQINSSDSGYKIGDKEVEILRTTSGKPYGFKIKLKEPELLEMQYEIKINIIKKDAKLVFEYNYI